MNKWFDKRYMKYYAIGAGAIFLLMVLPIVSKPFGQLVANVRAMLDGDPATQANWGSK